MAMSLEERAERRRRAQSIGAAALRIVTVDDADHEVLRRQARPVRHVNRRVRQLLERMAVTMYRADGVGLAGPQVGEGLRVFVVDAGEGLHYFINPEVSAVEGEEEYAYEGCLSIPGLLGEVARATKVRVHALDLEGREFWLDAEGFFARAIQHENDHLDGVLFTDRARKVIEASPETRLRVVYLGTPAFARDVLLRLVDADVLPVAVVTRPDKPRGRGQRPHPTPVRELALEADIPVLTSADASVLRDAEPDVLVTVAYGRILRPDVLALPRLAAINLHPSLLPLYRGPAPVLRAVWDGVAETGVTTMHMSDEVDAGDIILQEKVDVEPGEDRGTLERRLAERGARLLRQTLRLLARDEAPRQPQEHAAATYAPALRPGDEQIDWTLAATRLAGQVRALAPYPGATAVFRGQPLKVLAARAVGVQAASPDGAPGTAEPGDAASAPGDVPPGHITALSADGISVATGSGTLLVSAVQPAGRRRVTAAEFCNGHHPQIGEAL